MSAKTFLPHLVTERVAGMGPAATPASQVPTAQDRLGNAALVEQLDLLSAGTAVAQTTPGSHEPLSGVVAEPGWALDDYLGSTGLLMDDGWRADLVGLASGDGEVGGVFATLVDRERSACTAPDDCGDVADAAVDALGTYFGQAANALRDRLRVQAARVLARPTLLGSMADAFGLAADAGIRGLMAGVAGVIGGPVAGAVSASVSSKLRRTVSRYVQAFSTSAASATFLNDAAIGEFFLGYSLAWRQAIYVAQQDARAASPEAMREFARVADAMARAPLDEVVESIQVAILDPFLQMASASETATDAFGELTGIYNFTLEIVHDGEGHATPRTLGMPSGITPHDAQQLCKATGLWRTQTFELVSHDRSFVASVRQGAIIEVVRVEPWARESLQRLGCSDEPRVGQLRLRASEGDSAAEDELQMLEEAGVRVLWESVVSTAGERTPFTEVPGLRRLTHE